MHCTGIFNPGRSVYLIHYDSSINYENNGRSFKIGSGGSTGKAGALYGGNGSTDPENAFGSGRTLAVHMYMLSSEGLYMNQAYATAVILLILVVVINTLSGMIAKRLTKNREEKKNVEVKYQKSGFILW